jgi:transcriptional regulator with XRE-family HTH domain
MKERIQEFLIRENKTSAQLAEEIRVQPSGISHILSGRNKPSLDFILKMLEKYPFLSTEWLLFGKGSMYREPKMGDLFAGIDLEPRKDPSERDPAQQETVEAPEPPDEYESHEHLTSKSGLTQSITRIIWFFDDNTFEEFFPSKH